VTIIIENGEVRKLFSTSLSIISYFFVGQLGKRLVSYSLQLACHPFRGRRVQADNTKIADEYNEIFALVRQVEHPSFYE
jgi:hypothetical protein